MTSSRRATILIVDDEPQLLEFFSEVLADEYRVLETESGEAALGMLDEGVDVMLLDRRMPLQPGEHVLQRMREAGYDIPVAMLTGQVRTSTPSRWDPTSTSSNRSPGTDYANWSISW